MTTVHLSGHIDRRTVSEARHRLLDELRHGDELHIDLKDVEWIDSSGLAILVEIAQQTRRAGMQLHLHRVGEHVMKMMRLAHLDGIFSIHENRAGPTLH